MPILGSDPDFVWGERSRNGRPSPLTEEGKTILKSGTTLTIHGTWKEREAVISAGREWAKKIGKRLQALNGKSARIARARLIPGD